MQLLDLRTHLCEVSVDDSLCTRYQGHPFDYPCICLVLANICVVISRLLTEPGVRDRFVFPLWTVVCVCVCARVLRACTCTCVYVRGRDKGEKDKEKEGRETHREPKRAAFNHTLCTSTFPDIVACFWLLKCVFVCIFMCAHVCVCMYVCMYVCACLSICLSVHMPTCLSTHVFPHPCNRALRRCRS